MLSREALLTAPQPAQMDAPGSSVPMLSRQYTGAFRPEVMVFEGGGTKGIHYAGAIKIIDDAGILAGVRCFAGTSAGSQTAALLAFGYSGDEMEAMMHQAEWGALLDGTKGPFRNCCCCGYGVCKGCCRLIRSHGFYLGDYLQEFLEERFAAKRVNRARGCTFLELYTERNVELRVGACNLTTRQFEYLDRHSHPNMSVSQAVRASSAIPFVFLPQVVDTAVYVDGFLQGNLPVAAFPGKKVLGFHLTSSDSETVYPDKRTLVGNLSDILDMLQNSAQRKHGINFDTFVPNESFLHGSGRTGDPLLEMIVIDCGSHGLMETKLKTHEIDQMLEVGRHAATTYLRAQHRASSKPDAERSNASSYSSHDVSPHAASAMQLNGKADEYHAAMQVIERSLQSTPTGEVAAAVRKMRELIPPASEVRWSFPV